MPSNHKQFLPAFRGWRATTVLLLPLVLAALACGIQNGTDQSLKSTDIAISIQQTLMAQTATALEAGLAALPATLAAPTAESQPEATLPPSPTPIVITATSEPALPTDTPTVAVPPTSPAPDAIPIVDWGMQYWAPIPNGCKEKGIPCWKMDDDYHKHLGSADLVLISKNPVLIDPSWPNPRLVFWHKYDFSRFATVELKIELEMERPDGPEQKIFKRPVGDGYDRLEGLSRQEYHHPLRSRWDLGVRGYRRVRLVCHRCKYRARLPACALNLIQTPVQRRKAVRYLIVAHRYGDGAPASHQHAQLAGAGNGRIEQVPLQHEVMLG